MNSPKDYADFIMKDSEKKFQKRSDLMCCAAKEGNLEIFKHTASDYPGSNFPHWDWYPFVLIASEGKKEEECLEIIEYSYKFINGLGYYLPDTSVRNFVLNAITAGNSKIVKFFILRGANDWNLFMRTAAYVGNLEMVKYCAMLSGDDYSGCVSNAALGGHLNIINHFKYHTDINWDECASNAAFKGYVEIFKCAAAKSRLRELYCGKDWESKMDWQRYAMMAALGNHIEILRLMDGKGVDWDTCIRFVGNREIKDEIVKFMGGNIFED